MACMIKFSALIFVTIMATWSPQETLSSRVLNEPSMLERHELWIARHGRVYTDESEKAKRFLIFKENVERVEAFNAGTDKGYKLGVNQFADLTNEEFRASRNGYKRQSKKPLASKRTASFRYANLTDIPAAIDWRKEGAVTPIKNQGSCGSCWAFSAVAAVEGINKLKNGNLISFSEQELIDCDVNGQDKGCEGGLMDDAFHFIIDNKGLNTEDNYPYSAQDGTCNAQKAAFSAVKITGYEDVPANDEEALAQAVSGQPVSVSIDAGGYNFQLYTSGIYDGDCGTDLDHGVAAVGYGSDADGTKYWLVKNSWGASWGENGYVRIKRGVAAKEGLCGIAMDASYPVIA